MSTLRVLAGVVLIAGLCPVFNDAARAQAPQPPEGDIIVAPFQVPAPPPGVLFVADRDVAPDGAWLGVQLAPVPGALASHLKLGNKGVMVRNVFKDSPADKAGLDRYDVIVSVDGKELDHGMEMFSEWVHSRKAGAEAQFALYHGGEKKTVPVKLGEAPARPDEMALKYEDDPDVARRRLFEMRGKILRPGPDGWILDDLGEMPPLPQFDRFREGPGSRRTPKPEPSDVQESRRVDREGRVLQVRREKDGTIEVKRYKTGTPAEQVEARKYANVDELRKADPDAAQLLGSASSRPAEEREAPRPKNWDRLKKGMKNYDETLRRYQDDLEKYEDAIREYMQKYQGHFDQRVPAPPPSQWREWGEKFFPGSPDRPKVQPPPPPGREPLAEAKFDVLPDGSITAHVHDGPTELNMTFPNEEAFKKQAPRLYERYKETLDRTK